MRLCGPEAPGSQCVPVALAPLQLTAPVQALRALRALRPLRTINRFKHLRDVVIAFIDALPLISSVMVLTVSALFMWALICMQLFSRMYFKACVNDTTGELEFTDTEEFSCGARKCAPPPAVFWCFVILSLRRKSSTCGDARLCTACPPPACCGLALAASPRALPVIVS